MLDYTMEYQHDVHAENLIIKVPGDLTSTNAKSVHEDINTIKNNDSVKLRDWKILTVDLSNANIVDSIGLNVLVALIRDMQHRGCILRAIVKHRSVYRTFLATRLDKSIDIVYNEY